MDTTTQERPDVHAGSIAQQRAAQITTQPPARRIDPMQMVQAAIDKDMDPERLKGLMDLAERQQANIARQEFALAMACFKAEAPRLFKNKNVNFRSSKGVTNYNHATLDYILNQVCPVMSKYGLSHQWFNLQENGAIGVRCRLSHVLGHFEEVTLWGPADNSGNKNGIQAIGSTTTYLQRYTFLSITGLATEENPDEDDGYAAGGSQQEAQQDAPQSVEERPIVEGGITRSQLDQLRTKAKAVGISEQQLCGIARVEKLHFLRADRLQGAMAYLDQQGGNQQ